MSFAGQMDLKDGLYEEIINHALDVELESLPPNHYEVQALDEHESKVFLSRHMAKVLEMALGRLKEKYKESGLKKQVSMCNEIIAYLSEEISDDDLLDFKISNKTSQLLSIHKERAIKKERPETPLAISSLFTGNRSDPSLASELKKEIRTSDQLDLLVSFIRYSGLRLIMNDLDELSKRGKIRVITTTYMGATEAKAILELSKLPNTEIKIAYDLSNTRLHAKSYIFHRDTGFNVAYVGSSNLSNVALIDGKEWNVKITNKDLPHIFDSISATFETYWNSADFVKFEENDYSTLCEVLGKEKSGGKKMEMRYVLDAKPYTFQQQILDELDAERKIHGRFRNLVVAATGTGKTVVSAFDYKRFCDENFGKKNRLLFIAHRKEILDQSLATFRGILKDNNFGDTFHDYMVPDQMDHLFMTIQTFASRKFYNETSEDHYDFIIVDETHHGAAKSYEKVFTYYRPKILLGLTATPERMDGVDIIDYFDNKIASEIRLSEAIDRGFLVPFQYFCITDSISLDNIKFRGGKYDADELNRVYSNNKERARMVRYTIEKYSSGMDGIKALGFCVSQEHANFMSKMFNEDGVPAMSLTSLSSKEERNQAQSRLKRGEIKVIFTVDLYNEGVDIPEVNTVLFLRPTESLTVFTQQLGRGLRLHSEKSELTVFDFIGQANKKYDFRKKFEVLTTAYAKTVDMQIKRDSFNLPSGCHIQMERLAKEYILNNLKQTRTNRNKMVDSIREYVAETKQDMSLEGFLKYSEITARDLYSEFTFTKLCSVANIVSNSVTDEEEKFYKYGMERLVHIDSRRWIEKLREILLTSKTKLTSEEKKFALMLYYSFYSDPLEKEGFSDIFEFIDRLKKNKAMLSEMIQLLDYSFNNIHFMDKEMDLGFENTLDLHCTYTRGQILAGLGINTESKALSSREGVYYMRETNTDMFFVTVDKSEKDFSPTTMYNDFAISDRLFHWQSQSTIPASSETGLRYTNQAETGHNVILFVREKSKNKIAAPFVCLGKVKYVSSKGSKPISVTWELEEPIPPAVLEYARAVKE